jgi:hypothetical protein
MLKTHKYVAEHSACILAIVKAGLWSQKIGRTFWIWTCVLHPIAVPVPIKEDTGSLVLMKGHVSIANSRILLGARKTHRSS